MSLDIALTLGIVTLTIVLFISDKLRFDLIAMLVLGTLVITDLVTPEEALSGFSNPAVVTVWAVFILSSGLSRTGVANTVGKHVIRLAGESEVRLLVVIMLTAGIMSSFMNNIGVAALLLPVVINIARKLDLNPSKLLMPLAFGALMGGMTTLIGTPPNILASDALRAYNLDPFDFFDFLPVGSVILISGIVYMVVLGRRLLPTRNLGKEFGESEREFRQVFGLQERLFITRIPFRSTLIGKTLAQSRLEGTLGLNVIGLIRDGATQLAPDPDTAIAANDRLLVAGKPETLAGLKSQRQMIVADESTSAKSLVSEAIGVVELALTPGSSLIGKTLEQVDFRQQYGANVLGICRAGTPIRTHLQEIALKQGDALLIQIPNERLSRVQASPDLELVTGGTSVGYRLQERLFSITIPEKSTLAGQTLAQTRLGDAYGLTVLGIFRGEGIKLMPMPEDSISVGDTLIVEGRAEDLADVYSGKDLEIDEERVPSMRDLESSAYSWVEAVLAPQSNLAGKNLRQIHFREKYGLRVLAVWREGQAYYSNLRDMVLHYGDALLLHGRRQRLRLLASEGDFILMAEEIQEAPRWRKAPIAALIMLGVILVVVLGWLSMAVAAVIGASLMVLSGCLNMDEAYQDIDWRAVFLIACMLPLGIAMQTSGTADFLAEAVIGLVGDYGGIAIMAGLFIMATLASQFMPNAVVTVLMAPIAINTAFSLGLSPYALMMTIAIAASAAFLSPVGHPAIMLVMGPGGYRLSDYIRVGLPLTIIVLLITLLVLPIVWPL